MIRKYENDFTQEKKAESEAYRKVRKSYIPLLIISGAIVNFSTLFLIFRAPYTKGNSFGNQAVFIFCVIVGLIVFGLAIPLLIITLVKGSKNKIGKKEIPFKLAHYLTTLLVFLTSLSVLGSFICYDVTLNAKDHSSNIALYKSISSDGYTKLLNKEDTSTYKEIVKEKENFTYFVDRNIETLFNKSSYSYTTSEAELMAEYTAFEEKIIPIINDYYENNLCIITEDVESLDEFLETKALGRKIYSIKEALSNNVQIMELSPFTISKKVDLINSTTALYYYEKPVYYNHCELDSGDPERIYDGYNDCLQLEKKYDRIERKEFELGGYVSKTSSNGTVSVLDQKSTRFNRYEWFFNKFINKKEVFKKYNDNLVSLIYENYGSEQQLISWSKKYSRNETYRKTYDGLRIPLIVFAAINFVYVIFLMFRKTYQIRRLDYSLGVRAISYQTHYIQKPFDVGKALKAEDFPTAIKYSNVVQYEYYTKRKAEIEYAKSFIKELNLETKSTFDGHAIQLFGWNLLGWLVTIFTLGILYPVKVAWVEGWKINHRYINGKKLVFDGNGFQLLGRYMLWWLLSIVTLGIYLIVLPKKMQQWVLSHTHFVDIDHLDVKTKKLYLDHGVTNESKFEGKVIKLFFVKLGTGLLALITLGLLLPMRICAVYKWKVNGQNINGLKVRFNGHGIQLFGKYILWWLLSLVTLGIFAIFIPVKIEKWITKHSHFKAAYFDEEI